MPHIIISYRRADSDAIAGRIRDRLVSHFGESAIFMDIESIPFGIDFREHIAQALEESDILVAVIGPLWFGPGKDGKLRIAEDTDPVRIEVSTALQKGSPVIPVLVGGARMPDAADLPDSLKPLAYRNAAEVDAGRDFHPHMERLIRSIDLLLERMAKPPAQKPEEAPNEADTTAHHRHHHHRATEAVTGTDAKAEAPAAAGVPAAAAPPAATGAQRPRRSRMPWLVAAAVCLVAGVGGGAWFYARSRPPVITPPTAAPTAPPVATPTVAEPRAPARPVGVAAAGCKLDLPAVFADDFKSADPAWLLDARTDSHVDGELALNPTDDVSSRVLYPPLRFKNVTICARVKSPPQLGALDGRADAGVLFWATDLNNLYNAAIHPDGTYSIYRMVSSDWKQVTARTAFESIKTGPGAVNEIQVTTKDNAGTLWINGVKVQDFRGQPPRDGSMIGVYAASNKGERNEWRVLAFAAADPDAPAQARAASAPAPKIGPGCKPSRRAAFEDDFKSTDPGWGIVANSPAALADGEMAIKPPADEFYRLLYPSLLFRDATICAQVTSPARVEEIDANANGGLVFWAVNRLNFYVVAVYPKGSFDIYRMFNGEWARVLPQTKSESIKTGPGTTNEVMVSFGGGMAGIYVNGQKLFEFRGQPPPAGGSIGLFAASEKKAQSDWRFVNLTVVENE